MSEYHKIETLYERDEKTHRLIQPLVLKNATYGMLKTWHWTEKIDGTNIRLIWDGESVRVGGKTDNAQLDSRLLARLQKEVPAEKFAEVFGAEKAVVYGEGYGAGIQKGGCYRPDKALIVFDVRVADTWWLNWANTCDVAQKLGLDTVPYVGEFPLEEAAEMVRVGVKSHFGDFMAEGLVGRPEETLFDKKGARLIVKLKTKDF